MLMALSPAPLGSGVCVTWAHMSSWLHVSVGRLGQQAGAQQAGLSPARGVNPWLKIYFLKQMAEPVLSSLVLLGAAW